MTTAPEMTSAPGPHTRTRIPMAWIIGLTVAVTAFAGLVAAWMYWLALAV